MKLLTILLVLVILGCSNPDRDPLTGESLSGVNRFLGGYDFQHKGHWFLKSGGGGIIHAPYCECTKCPCE